MASPRQILPAPRFLSEHSSVHAPYSLHLLLNLLAFIFFFAWPLLFPADSGFQGRRHEDAPGIMDFRHRQYDAKLGRFLSRDPGQDPRNQNPYTFCANDPVNRRDPLGDRLYAAHEDVARAWEKRLTRYGLQTAIVPMGVQNLKGGGTHPSGYIVLAKGTADGELEDWEREFIEKAKSGNDYDVLNYDPRTFGLADASYDVVQYSGLEEFDFTSQLALQTGQRGIDAGRGIGDSLTGGATAQWRRKLHGEDGKVIFTGTYDTAYYATEAVTWAIPGVQAAKVTKLMTVYRNIKRVSQWGSTAIGAYDTTMHGEELLAEMNEAVDAMQSGDSTVARNLFISAGIDQLRKMVTHSRNPKGVFQNAGVLGVTAGNRRGGNSIIGGKYQFERGSRVRNLQSGRYVSQSHAFEDMSKKVNGNTAGDQPAVLYKKFSKKGRFLKWGVTQEVEDPSKRYTKKEMAGGRIVPFEFGPRKELLKKERFNVETNPGPENREPWAGSRRGQ